MPNRAERQGQTDSGSGQVFLLTDTGILAQEEGTRLWRSIPAQHGSAGGADVPTAAQLRSLRRNPGGGRSRPPHAASGGTAQRPKMAEEMHPAGTVEIYNPLTATWSAVPRGARRAQVGETVCCLLPDGRMLIGARASASCATYDPARNQWSTAALPPGSARRTTGVATVIAVRVSD
ncbi:MAG: hypothetical protein NVSMB32_05630 [Actinomycetota bacterium]